MKKIRDISEARADKGIYSVQAIINRLMEHKDDIDQIIVIHRDKTDDASGDIRVSYSEGRTTEILGILEEGREVLKDELLWG